MPFQDKEDALVIFKNALEAVNPGRCVLEHVNVKGNVFSIDGKEYDLKKYRSIFIVAFGKAAPSMAQALQYVIGERITGGIVVSNERPPHAFSKMRFYLSSHPVPDERSLNAAREVLKLLEDAGENDLVIFLISGGGSALLAMPSQGISIEDKRKATEMLLKTGVDTYGLNAVRKHISQIKGGGLLKKALPAQAITLILSDVAGDRLDAIASGPTVPDPTTFEDAWRVIEKLRLEHRIPPPVIIHLEEGRRGNIPETLKREEFRSDMVQTVIVGNNLKSLVAAERKARELGYNTVLLSSQIQGESREVAKVIAAIALDIERFDIPVTKPACLIFGGETTVTVTGDGKGGRNTETSLAFSMEIMGHQIVGLFCGTDGIDGPTDAAGAISDGTTRLRARKINLSARESLSQNDSYSFFEKLGDLIKTGPTGTNVMDIGVVLVK
ncbi:MAG TPA: glycerate kinase [Thermodesulfobacteriota bacterium]